MMPTMHDITCLVLVLWILLTDRLALIMLMGALVVPETSFLDDWCQDP